MEYTVILGVALMAFAAGNVTGFLGAKVQHWWRGLVRSTKRYWPLLKYSGMAVVGLGLFSAVLIKGWF